MKASKRLIIAFTLILFLLLSLAVTVNAESEYFSTLTEDEIEAIFELETDDIAHAWNWISEAQTFVIIERNDGDIVYWWNTPNIQMSAFNSLYSMVQLSGYGSGHGVPASKRDGLVDVPPASEAHTAMQKYGFDIPSPAYMGERPLITISILGVLLPDDFGNGLSRLGGLIFGGDIVSIPTEEDLNTLLYLAPRDYTTSSNTFQAWVAAYWYDIMHDGPGDDPYIQPGQILLSKADASGKYNGDTWVRDTIIDQHGLADLTDADVICQKLSEICGQHYSDVAKNIILTSGIDSSHVVKRIMPYDLTRMNPIDLDRFGGIVDPRSEQQENVFSTGYANLFSNMFKSVVLDVSSSLAEIAIALNSLCNFEYLDSIDLDPTLMWTAGIIEVVILILLVILVFYIVRTAFAVVRGRKSYGLLLSKVFCIFLIAMTVFAIASSPGSLYKTIRDVSVSVWNISNASLEYNPSLSALYGDTDTTPIEKEACSLWLPYFNTWTSYQTSHTLLDNSQLFDTSILDPEEEDFEMPFINTKQQDLWSTVLADNFTSNTNYTGNIYRVVDHFMAPRIIDLELDDDEGNASFLVDQNENFTDKIQSSINFASIPFQFLILILVAIKVLIFFEFILNIMMLFINVCLTVTQTKELGKVLKKTGASMLNVGFCNIAITLVIYSSLIADGYPGVVISFFYYFLVWQILKKIFNSHSVFKPKFMELAQKGFRRVGNIFQENGGF